MAAATSFEEDKITSIEAAVTMLAEQEVIEYNDDEKQDEISHEIYRVTSYENPEMDEMLTEVLRQETIDIEQINNNNINNGMNNGYVPPPPKQQPSSMGQTLGGGHMQMPAILQHSPSKLLLNLDKYKNAQQQQHSQQQHSQQEDDDEANDDEADQLSKQVNLAEERIDLVDTKKELAFNQRDMEKQIERDRDLMQKLSAEIRPASRRNFELEKNLSVLDKQIQLLIQNMISLAELNDMAGGVFTQAPANQNQMKSPLLGKKKLYEQLFHILQKEPKYFAALAKHVRAREVSDYVKTVVFDMYGDQYDSREERLLLTLFQMVLKQSFDEAQDIGSFLRANTAITQMLSAYARRGQGLGILREILEKPIREMVAQTSLNLEINPVEVYKQIINSYEAKMNKPWDGIRNPTSDEAAENKYVKRLIPPRVKQLEYIAEHFIQRIIETVDSVPFGIRWICRQLAEMAQQRFPEADRYQIGGLVGGYIYLRFFNPVVVTPESVHFVDKKSIKNNEKKFNIGSK
eukprot:274348_1